MSIKAKFLWMEAHGFVHVGIGKQPGLIDQPISRESGTNLPYVAGSGAKGAYRDLYRTSTGCENDAPEVIKLFGLAADSNAENETGQGAICINDIQILALPVRSPTHGTVYITCPTILRRLIRNLEFAGLTNKGLGIPDVDSLVTVPMDNQWDEQDTFCVLENYKFDVDISKIVSPPDNDNGKFLPSCLTEGKKFLVLADKDFQHFSDFHIHVRVRNALEPTSKVAVSGALWNEESLPPGTLFTEILHIAPKYQYSKELSEIDEAICPLLSLLKQIDLRRNFFQVGGNETVGEGIIKIVKIDSGDLIAAEDVAGEA